MLLYTLFFFSSQPYLQSHTGYIFAPLLHHRLPINTLPSCFLGVCVSCLSGWKRQWVISQGERCRMGKNQWCRVMSEHRLGFVCFAFVLWLHTLCGRDIAWTPFKKASYTNEALNERGVELTSHTRHPTLLPRSTHWPCNNETDPHYILYGLCSEN